MVSRGRLALLILTAGLLVVGQMPALLAQEARATMVGRVIDSSGGAIPGAEVGVINQAMGTKLSLITNDVGFYQATYLITGLYQIVVEMPGFKRYRRDNLEVRVGDRLEVDITLEVGEVEETVTVTGETPLLDTATASTGTVVDARRITDLPIPHSNPYLLIGLAAGTTFMGNPKHDRPYDPTGIVGYAMDGTRANRSDITIDGVPATSTARDKDNQVIASYVPPAEIVSEFKVQTATFDAAVGQTEGGVTNLSLKSGTSKLHGTAYLVKMLPGTFANDFFANRAGIPRNDAFYYNRWGGSAGGPVSIPKLYNGKEKTFFMWGYEGIHESRPRSGGNQSVPTPLMKQGDFSELLALGPQYQIYNPFTRRALPNGTYQQDPFPGNIIPPNLINPVARKLLEYYPDPLVEGRADKSQNYPLPNLPEVVSSYNHSLRMDHMVSDRQTLTVRGSFSKRASTYNNFFNNLVSGQDFQFMSRNLVIDDVYTVNPLTVLNIRYGYNRFIRTDQGNRASQGFDLTTLGFPQAYNDAIPASIRRFPRFKLSGFFSTLSIGYWMPTDTHSFAATLNRQQGSHSVKGGMELRVYRENEFTYSHDDTGFFEFGTAWTKGPYNTSAAAPRGQDLASLLLGLPTGGSVQRSASYAEQSLSWGFYLHDDWRLNNRLTLNLGLRWEFESPITERFNRSVTGFDRNYAQPFEAAAQAKYAANFAASPAKYAGMPAQINVRGGPMFAGINGESRGLYETPKNQLLPRIGLAYKLTDKTVMRAGYGIFFGFLGARRSDVLQYGFTQSTPFVASNDNGLSFVATLSNPFPNGILEPVGAANGYQTYLGQNIVFFNQNPLAPQMQRWQLSLQRGLPGGFVAEAAYVGNRGTHLDYNRNPNAIPNPYLSASPTRDQATINWLAARLPNPFKGLLPASVNGEANITATNTSSTLPRWRLLTAFPVFGNVITTEHDGYSWYHALQLGLRKRFSKGYTVEGNYTFSKFMQATELLNEGDPQPVEVISESDRPHRLTVSGILELPFGAGKPFGSGLNPVLSKIVSGWQLNGIYAYQSGAPLQWGNIIFTGDLKDIRLVADRQTPEGWFNTDAGFEKNSKKQLASNVRSFPLRFGHVRQDNFNNIDLSVIKNTTLAEGKSLQFKAEFLNAFNHPLFPAPVLVPTNKNFGKIVKSTALNYPRRVQLGLKFIF